jgi:hypothetical protein
MANLLESSQSQATVAPEYYNDYLSNLATAGTKAADTAQYIGTQDLQQQAFDMTKQNAGQFQAPINQAQQLATQAGQVNPLNAANPYLAGASASGGLNAAAPYIQAGSQYNAATAAQPYLNQAATSGGLSQANPYLQQATQSPAEMAQQYMNPYIKNAAQSMSDIAQRNIQQNLTPMATAAAVGSGQFGSQRGAQVQGQVQAQANQDLNNTLSQMLSTGYGQALTAAGNQNQLLGQLGNTAGTLGQQQASLLGQLGSTAGSMSSQQAQNLINAGNVSGTLGQQQANLLGQLGSTAGNLATQQGQLQNTAAQNLGVLGQAGQQMSLADINALSTMGGQQQTIAQNAQNYPLSNLSTLSGLIRGYNIPTSVKTTATGSPLSALAGLTTGAAGLFTPTKFDANGNAVAGSTPWAGLSGALGDLKNTVGGWFNTPVDDGSSALN